MKTHRYIACDLGAESGRVILGVLLEDTLEIEVVHRFVNDPLQDGKSIRWNVPFILGELKTGIRKACAVESSIEGLSCDSWGIDYVLIGEDGSPVAPPFHYRDARTDEEPKRAFAIVPQEEIYAETGIQFMSINTLYQLLTEMKSPAAIERARTMLNIGDYFNYCFSGVARGEESLASTTQLYNPVQRRWSDHLIRQFGMPSRLFPQLVPSGTVLGKMTPSMGNDPGAGDVSVIAGCSHDTGAAVAAVPAEGRHWAYLSSGTWSLLGVELPHPVITGKSRGYGFTNEVGFGGTIRFLKNISGLWIVQECRRAWASQGNELTYDQLMTLAAEAEPMVSFVNPLDSEFAKPGDMPGKIARACEQGGWPSPRSVGATIRCVLESLAVLYRRTLEQLRDCAEMSIEILHVVGGGSRNRLLNQLTADVTGMTVLAGPAECTAIGNILIQAIALGHIQSLARGREIVRNSFPVERFEPRHTNMWERVAARMPMTTS